MMVKMGEQLDYVFQKRTYDKRGPDIRMPDKACKGDEVRVLSLRSDRPDNRDYVHLGHPIDRDAYEGIFAEHRVSCSNGGVSQRAPYAAGLPVWQSSRLGMGKKRISSNMGSRCAPSTIPL